jgi:hypothetical protein
VEFGGVSMSLKSAGMNLVIELSPAAVGATPPFDRREAEVDAGFLARLDAGADENVQRLRLLERIDRVVGTPDEFGAGLVHAVLDHKIECALDPRLQRRQPSCVACWPRVSLVARLTCA